MSLPPKSGQRKWRWVFGVAGGYIVLIFMVSFFSPPPANLGVHDGRLAPCPNSPNCVSSQETDPTHAIEPFRFAGSPAAAMDRLRTVVVGQRRVNVITSRDTYLHAEFRSAVFRFVDDMEFLLQDDVIHVRSASRLGYSDLGVNRKRVEALRQAWMAAGA